MRPAAPPRALSLLLAAAVLAVAACSGGGGGGDRADGDDEGAGREGGSEAAEAEEYTGPVEGFYDVPDPLPPGEPGDLIRTMPIEAPEGQVGLRIMYHSTDAAGDDRAVTGVLYHPTAEPPEGGWPILAWAHGTTGIAPQCAPSRGPLAPPTFGVEGVIVAADYQGLGPNGQLHPYLSAAAEGHAVVDSVAAARALSEAHAGDRWAVAGHSQGGHAALVTNEMAADRLPDAELVGTVAIAPGAQLAETYGDEVQTRIITAIVLFGAAAENAGPDAPDVDPRDYLSPEVYEAAADVMEDACLGEIISTLLPFAGREDFFTTDPRTEAAGTAWLEQNDPGQVRSDAPLLLVQGGRDTIVVPARTEALVDRLCDLGQVVDRIDLPNADHDTEPREAADEIEAWLDARFAGEEAQDDC
ncbi:MAG TPA: lipase family protein [Acidimicrobiales bacterium]